ncbi:MAG TPA: hypothetical protein VK700_01095 [Steroidobacteraceae bacterium]|jgi:hypothetical protein|nr:hypothetical protein [Steroidobacteraceae bacterium]
MTKLRWGWIVLGGFLVELATFAFVIPISLLAGRQSLLYSAPLASFVASVAFGFLVARKSANRPVLHGTLVGLVAVLIFLGMSRAGPEPIAYVIAHVLKLLGGAFGGYRGSRGAQAV